MKKIILGSLLVASSLFASADVLAVVNGTKITKQEVNQLLSVQNITYDRLNPMQQRQVLDQIIVDKILQKRALKSGVENTKLYKTELKKLEEKLALAVYKKELLDKIKVSDKEIKDFYNKNKDIMFKRPEEVLARHILVDSKEKAQEIINELKNTPQSKLKEKFIELAKKYSKGPTGEKGGLLGWFKHGQMVPAFDKAVFSLKVNSFTLRPVKTQYGWHVIYVEDKKEATVLPFEKVKNYITQQLKIQKFQKELANIKSQANIQYK